MSGKIKPINKVFANLVYEKNMSDYKEGYRINDFQQTINSSEK